MTSGIFYYKLESNYSDDITKNCKLTINEIDHNFKTLKDNDISAATFSDGALVLTKNDGDSIIVPLGSSVGENLVYDLNVDADPSESGVTLTISYKDNEGEKTTILPNILTVDDIDVGVLSKVIRDNTLRGIGTMTSPLGIAGTEKTGMLAPALKFLDLTEGGELPEETKANTRYVTKELVNDYGYLYNGNGVNKIIQKLDDIYDTEQIYKEVKGRSYYWHVPTKEDWDRLLNSVEPCEYRNHGSEACHVELGKVAGKYLKTQCGWVGQEACNCASTRPYTGCSTDLINSGATDDTNPYPSEDNISPIGIDKFGMSILPAGISEISRNIPRPDYFTEKAAFWSTSHVHGDESQDFYVKVFEHDKGGVYQEAECPEHYFSVRLVKDFDGENFRDAEYIDGVLYKCVLMAESGQVWLQANFANKNGFVPYDPEVCVEPDYLKPNNGEDITENRAEIFINEYNGHAWERRVMEEGETIVIENPCFDHSSGTTTTICWHDSHGEEHCIEVEIPKISQNNLEYRVYTDGENCDKTLINTDEILVERVLHTLVPMLEQEREERIEADELLDNKINEEIAAREASDEVFSGAIDSLSAASEAFSGAIDVLSAASDVFSGEIDTIKEDISIIDGQLIDWSQNPFDIKAAVSSDENNIVLPTKDGNEDHYIKINFDGNFGEI